MASEEIVEEEFDIFSIDKNRLDEELVKQPEMVEKWGEKLALARERLERAKRSRDVVEAETSLKIRKSPKDYEVDKVTEGVVKDLILIDKDCSEANERVLKAKHKVEMYEAKMTALNDRKYAIQKLVDLRLAEYFAEPKLGGGIKKKIKDRAADMAFGSLKND